MENGHQTPDRKNISLTLILCDNITEAVRENDIIDADKIKLNFKAIALRPRIFFENADIQAKIYDIIDADKIKLNFKAIALRHHIFTNSFEKCQRTGKGL